ncbi:SDR family NAD(P)-dependent oxidoreductase [Nonomuraea sp. NPDC052265]|uniref:SDR family NAD(P)-dependent oxidoreductase n=1 Tax=Nonomuraea sp. NPDC052265 TaxID=3364374 RepID=UPI0037CA75E3
MIGLVHERFGTQNVLVNLAGIVDWPGIEDTAEDAWDRVIDVNQKGTWLGRKAAMPLLRASGNASMINTSSVLVLVGSGSAAAYQASKGAVRAGVLPGCAERRWRAAHAWHRGGEAEMPWS